MSASRAALLATGERLPVLVVGGGIGGFTAALALHRAGIRSNVIMPEASFSKSARSAVMLGSSAVRILDRLGLGSRFRTFGLPMTRAEISNVRGRAIMSIDLDSASTEVWIVPRPNLQQLFVEALPPGAVHFGTKFRSLHSDGDTVVAELQQDASIQSARTFQVEASLVVGADGPASAVRRHMSRPAMTVPSGVLIWRGVVRNRDTKKYPLHTGREIWAKNERFGFTRMSPEEVVWWAVTQNQDNIFLRPFQPRLLDIFKDFPDSTLDLISAVSKDRDIYRREMKLVWPHEFPWVDATSRRIALVGDAGRSGDVAMLHYGCTFAIEDSYALAFHLAERRAMDESRMTPALLSYEQGREDQEARVKRYISRLNRLTAVRTPVTRYLLQEFVMTSLMHQHQIK